MFTKTSSYFFQKYGDTFITLPQELDNYNINKLIISNNTVNSLYYNSNDIYIHVNDGIAVICVSKENQSDKFEQFVIHHTIRLKKGCYFNFLSISDSSVVTLYTQPRNNIVTEPINGYNLSCNYITPSINVNQILVYYYQVKSSNYEFKGEKHNYWELTYIDSGHLVSKVDGVEYNLKQHDILLYSPGQFHTQNTASNEACSYLTIIFKLDFDHQELLNNQVFCSSRKIINILQEFIDTIDKNGEYDNDLCICLLNQVIIHLLQFNKVKKVKVANSPIQQKFEDELLNEIILYANQNVYLPLSVDHLCQQFSISRSSLQQLFNKNLNVAPKQYLTQIKLKKAKLLIKENKYTISEVSEILGFTSIHYFSRKFKKEFNISPSDYAKSIYKKYEKMD